MQPGKLDKRILVKRLSKTADGFGGFTSTNATNNTIWANLNYTGGSVENKSGRKKRNLQVEILIRKKTAEDILITDLLQIENVNGFFQINDMFDSNYKYYTTITATKRD